MEQETQYAGNCGGGVSDMTTNLAAPSWEQPIHGESGTRRYSVELKSFRDFCYNLELAQSLANAYRLDFNVREYNGLPDSEKDYENGDIWFANIHMCSMYLNIDFSKEKPGDITCVEQLKPHLIKAVTDLKMYYNAYALCRTIYSKDEMEDFLQCTINLLGLEMRFDESPDSLSWDEDCFYTVYLYMSPGVIRVTFIMGKDTL